MSGLNLSQFQKLSQQQILSPLQIQTLNILHMSSDELWKEIEKKLDENPALVLKENSRKSSHLRDSTKESSRISKSQQEASDNFQNLIDSQQAPEPSLKENLLSQLHMQKISEEENSFCESIIQQLNSDGFLVQDPLSMLQKGNPFHTPSFAKKCLNIIQHLDPIGCASKNWEEALFIQAKERKDADSISLFLLDGRLMQYLPCDAEKLCKKLGDYFKSLGSIFRLEENAEKAKEKVLSKNGKEFCQKSLDFIRSLNPNLSSGFSTEETLFASEDIEIELISDSEEMQNFKERHQGHTCEFIPQKGKTLALALIKDSFPQLEIDSELKKLSQNNGSDKSNVEIEKQIKDARTFIEQLSYRQNTVMAASIAIAKKQSDFFEYGEGHLLPLTQKEIAKELNIHETTMSRIASSKFIRTKWGLFPISHFFSSNASSKQKGLSRDKVEFEIKKIIEENKISAKKISDQKIMEKLKERGMEISRRTVTKYRSQMNIESSYTRQ